MNLLFSIMYTPWALFTDLDKLSDGVLLGQIKFVLPIISDYSDNMEILFNDYKAIITRLTMLFEEKIPKDAYWKICIP